MSERRALLWAVAFVAVMGVIWWFALREAPIPAISPVSLADRSAAATPAPLPTPPKRPTSPRSARQVVAPPSPSAAPEPTAAPTEEGPELVIRGIVTDSNGATVAKASIWGDWENDQKRAQHGRWVSNQDGRFEFSLDPTRLTLWAERMDGKLAAKSERVDIDGTEGGAFSVDLVVPGEAKGGLGIGIGRHRDGVAVQSVHPGTPAEEVGLEKGDVIIEVDGASTKGMKMEDFIARMTGSVGSRVNFVVRTPEGAEEQVEVRRALIE